MTNLSLLAIFAHPDDEAFITGGTLALCADRGIATYVISATAGDAGRSGGLAASAEELGKVRAEEFAASCALLGVHEHAMLGYGDGRLAQAPFDEAVGRVVELIRRWRPTVALSFGREGGSNSHRDHRAICRIATAAVLAAGDELCYSDQIGLRPGLAPHAVEKFYLASAPDGVVSRDGTRFDRPTTSVDISTVVERKLAAFRVHSSQVSLVPRLEEWIAENGNAEHYTRALSRVRVPAVETDLFGVTDTEPVA
jgi:LmbE family N-acetylglucosaminyl deacetylase